MVGMLRVLAVTNMYPTKKQPFVGTFIQQQVQGLRAASVDVEVFVWARQQHGMLAYGDIKEPYLAHCKRFNPDIVHVMYGGLLAYLISLWTPKHLPVVISLCGSDVLGERDAGFVRFLLAQMGVMASYSAIQQSAAVIVKSNNLAHAIRQMVEPARIRVLPNGVDTHLFKAMPQSMCRAQLGFTDTFDVLFPSNSGHPVKRVWLAEAAVALLQKQGVPAVLRKLSGVAHNQVPIWMNACHVLLLCSSHEGSPNVVKEALSCGLPIVSVEVGDVRERIAGIDGCYLVADNKESMAQQLLHVFKNKKRIHADESVKSISLTTISKKLETLYRELLLREY